MKIYDINNTLILDVPVDDDSYQRDAVMSEDNLFLYYSLQDPVALPLYSYCDFNGRRYTLMDEENFTKINTENHAYKVTLESFIGYLKRCKFEYFTLDTAGKINSDIEIDFSLTMSPAGFARLIVDNMNQKDSSGGWQLGECIKEEERLLDFSDMYCLDALTYIAEQFNTEWEVSGKTIHIRKVERDKENPLPLEYGKGKGLLSGLERTNFKNRIGAVRVKTSDRNTNKATYGSATLKLPKNHTVIYNGIEYITDASGSRLMRKTPIFKSPIIPEDTLDLTHIYPRRVGTISSVIKVDEKQNLYDIIDADNEIDYSNSIIPGENMTLIFQGGQLSGREFDVSYLHKEKRFEIVPLTERGQTYPVPGIEPEVGGKYAIFHISLPQEYITNAELEALDLTLKYLYEHEQPQFTYKATLDKIFAKARWKEVGRYFNPGYFIRLTEAQHLPEPVDIRVVAVKRYVNNPYMPELELSNSVTGQTVGSSLDQLPNREQTIERNKGEAISFIKRRFRDADQALTMLEKAIQGYSEGINPIWIKSMAALFGDETLQFRYVNNKATPETISSGIEFNNVTKVFTCPARIIQHMSIGINELSSQHPVSSYTFFDMQPFERTLINETEAMYLYAKCNKTTKQGTYLLTTEPHDFDNADGHYYLLVGILSDEYDSYRSYVECYGFTEILPGRITLWKIVDPDGFQFWDMQNQAFRIGNENNHLAYNVDGLRRMMVKGIMVQSPSGEIDYLEVDRGTFKYGTPYYLGDKIFYDGNVYKCIKQTTGSQYPTNTGYWKLLVTKGSDGGQGDDGKDGKDGKGYTYAYYPSDSITPPTRPGGTTGNTPSGWWSYPNFNNRRYIYVSQAIYEDGKWSEWSTPTLHAKMGEAGPGVVFRGEFDKIPTPKIFYNNAARRDVVKYNSQYWIYRGNDATTQNSFISNNWESFGAQFSSVATELLLAETANIGGWMIRDEVLESQTGGSYLNGKTGEVKVSGRFESKDSYGNKIIVDAANRSIILVDMKGQVFAELTYSAPSSANPTSEDLYGRLAVNWHYYDQSGRAKKLWEARYSAHEIRYTDKDGEVYQFSPSGMRFNSMLPTKPDYLESGTVWRDGNTLKVK